MFCPENALKRVFDITLAAICLVVFAPLMAVCYLAVRIDDGGPAIMAQERIGRGGRPFMLYKFRSMKAGAETDRPLLYTQALAGRLTRVGRFLREHHLDELPQLWNVLRGDMAFVGPRPERKYYIDQIIKRDARYVRLYRVRPGVTSYATLRHGYTPTVEKMVERLHYDLYYLDHASWRLDLKILWLTFFSIVSGKKF